MAIALDTLAYARRLREAGFTKRQAEALAAAMTDTLATKQDLSELETRMAAGFAAAKHDVRALEIRMDARLDARLADLERRMTMRLGGVTVAAIGPVSALVRLL